MSLTLAVLRSAWDIGTLFIGSLATGRIGTDLKAGLSHGQLDSAVRDGLQGDLPPQRSDAGKPLRIR